MGGGKPTVPENLMGTLTSSDDCSAHTSSFTYLRYASYAVATVDYLKPFRLENYVRVVAFSPDSIRAFFYSGTISLLYSTKMMFLSFMIHM